MRIFNINSHNLGHALIVFDALFVGVLLLLIDIFIDKDSIFNSKTTFNHGLFIILIGTFCFSMGFYKNCYQFPNRFFKKTAVSFAMILAIMLFLAMMFPFLEASSYTIVSATVFASAAILLTRLAAAKIAGREGFHRRILVIGSPRNTIKFNQLQHVAHTTRFTFFRPSLDEAGRAAGSDAERLTGVRRTLRAHELILPDEYHVGPDIAAALLECRLEGARVTLLSAFMEKETRKIELSDDEAHRLILTCSARRRLMSRVVKRFIDVVGSVLLLIFTLPLLVVVAVAIKLEDGGPIFYRQARLGLGGQSFMLTKFRTMRVDAEADGVSRWASTRDDRVTTVGRLLRGPRIDEIPQLFDILLGRMSLVGPRPEQVPMCETLAATIPLYGYRHLVPPGLTGWAQINLPYAASLEETEEKTRYDLYYLKNGSVILDVIILIQTIRIVLFSEGSR